VIAWRAIGLLLLALFGLAVITIATGMSTGGMAEFWPELRVPVLLLAALLVSSLLLLIYMAVMRLRGRDRRDIMRYQLLLPQSDEATREELSAATDAVVQTVRATFFSRMFSGQPWMAIETWHIPPTTDGETGKNLLFLLCERGTRDGVMSALRRVSPNLALGISRTGDGAPMAYDPPKFAPQHVLRVRKSREWILPIAAQKSSGDGSNARSVMASTIRHQQDLGREHWLSCVRICIMPADASVDRLAATRLRRMADQQKNANAAISADVLEAQQGGGGTLSFVEYQAAVEYQGPPLKKEPGFAELQTVCKRLLSAGMSHRSANTLVERQVIVRQRLYRRRWARATPPWLPDQSGATIFFPNELAALIELPALGAEHDLPLGRTTIPYLPAPPGLTRARLLHLPPVPPDTDPDSDDDDAAGSASGAGAPPEASAFAWTQATADSAARAPRPDAPGGHSGHADVTDDDDDVEVLFGELVHPRRARWRRPGRHR